MFSLIEEPVARNYILYAFMYTQICVHLYTYIYSCSSAYIHPSMHTYMSAYIHPCLYIYIHAYICHTGVFSGTIKSLVCALGANSSMTKPTSTQLYMYLLRKSTFMIFRRWSYSLPYVLYPLWFIPIWLTPCIIKQNI